MKALALLILLLLPSLALGQQQYYNSKAASVSLPAPAETADLQRLTIHPGDVITPEKIRSSIQALYDTGRYRTIEVDATTGPGGTQVSFIVTVQYYFSTFRLEPGTLLDRPITSYFQTPLGKKFSQAPVDRMIVDTIKLIEENGYFNATITPEYSFNPNNRLATVLLKATANPKRAKLRTIQISGGQQIFPDKDLLSALKLSQGDDFNLADMDKGTANVRKKFFEKGYLTAKVRVDRKYDSATNTVDLNFTVDPGQTTIVQVIDSATMKPDIPDAKLRPLVPIFEEGTVDPDLVEEGRAHIVEYYQQQGHFDAVVTSEIAPVDQSVRIQYTVVKGELHTVQSIGIAGSAFFSESDILKKMKNQQGKSVSHGRFSPDLLAADVRTIQTMYRNAGLMSAVVESKEEETPPHNINITIQIHEGLRSVLGDVTFSGNKAFSEPDLWRESGIQSDQVYSAAIIDNARDALAVYYYTHGYPDVRIEPHVNFESVYNTVSVNFEITEGQQYRIGWILVAGNTHTAEKVISRNSELHPEDPYNPEALLEAQQRLYALGIFNRVEIVTIDQDLGEYKNLLIQVEDVKPILITPGIGVTELDGPRATFEVSDINLFGLDRTLSMRVRAGRRERQFQSTYREPRLFNHDIQGIAAITFDKTHHPFFDSNGVDFSLETVKKLSKTRTVSLLASYQTVNLKDIKVNPNVRHFPDATGVVKIARLGGSFLGEHRDNVIDPTRGTLTTASLQVANKAWGSQVNFTSVFVQTSYYKRVPGGVLATSVRAGWKNPFGGDKELPISERFFAGGSTTLRGFKLDDAGPPGGGQLLSIANVEYRKPLNFLPISHVAGAVFYDTGNVFERPSDFSLTKFTHTVGTGLRYNTPLGPLRLDVGFNLRSKTTERRYRVFFTLGHAF